MRAIVLYLRQSTLSDFGSFEPVFGVVSCEIVNEAYRYPVQVTSFDKFNELHHVDIHVFDNSTSQKWTGYVQAVVGVQNETWPIFFLVSSRAYSYLKHLCMVFVRE